MNDFILGPNLLANANLSGAYLDDEYVYYIPVRCARNCNPYNPTLTPFPPARWYNFSIYPGGCSGSPVGGPTEEDTHCLVDTGHSGDLAWTTAMTDAWCAVRHRAFEAALAAGGWFWCVSLRTAPAAPATAILAPENLT